MVRVKYRYFLAEILTERYNTATKLPLQDRDLKKAILEHVQNLFGDYGYACMSGGYSLKMFNPVTRIFIVRIHRKHQNILRAALPLLTAIDGLKLSIRLLHLSGTIRSSMKFLVQYDREKLSKLIQSNQLSSDDSKQLSELVAKYQNKLSNIGV